MGLEVSLITFLFKVLKDSCRCLELLVGLCLQRTLLRIPGTRTNPDSNPGLGHNKVTETARGSRHRGREGFASSQLLAVPVAAYAINKQVPRVSGRIAIHQVFEGR